MSEPRATVKNSFFRALRSVIIRPFSLLANCFEFVMGFVYDTFFGDLDEAQMRLIRQEILMSPIPEQPHQDERALMENINEEDEEFSDSSRDSMRLTSDTTIRLHSHQLSGDSPSSAQRTSESLRRIGRGDAEYIFATPSIRQLESTEGTVVDRRVPFVEYVGGNTDDSD